MKHHIVLQSIDPTRRDSYSGAGPDRRDNFSRRWSREKAFPISDIIVKRRIVRAAVLTLDEVDDEDPPGWYWV